MLFRNFILNSSPYSWQELFCSLKLGPTYSYKKCLKSGQFTLIGYWGELSIFESKDCNSVILTRLGICFHYYWNSSRIVSRFHIYSTVCVLLQTAIWIMLAYNISQSWYQYVILLCFIAYQVWNSLRSVEYCGHNIFV